MSAIAASPDGVMLSTAPADARLAVNLLVAGLIGPQEDCEELLVIRVDGETKIERNDVVHVGTPDKVHFFDPGGDRLGDVDVPVS